ncbi:hypothetical protein IGI96_003600 [Enterococcus sp. DIV0421]|uniref:helix-turn-helix domain-containing protein n=1 Tax=Enterococcus sp. DIV0421 TaxID=2774688 RepID=UPI003F27E1DD
MRSNKEIVQIIDAKRIEKKMSISELARDVGMAKSAVSRYFNYTREFPLNRIEDFANALGLSSKQILGFSDNEEPNDITNDSSELIPLDKKLGLKILQVREQKNISRDQFARILNISIHELKAYEDGIKPFSVHMTFRFAIALNLTFDELFPEDIKYEEIPAIVKVDETNKFIVTADGNKYELNSDEMKKVKNLLIYMNRQ